MFAQFVTHLAINLLSNFVWFFNIDGLFRGGIAEWGLEELCNYPAYLFLYLYVSKNSA